MYIWTIIQYSNIQHFLLTKIHYNKYYMSNSFIIYSYLSVIMTFFIFILLVATSAFIFAYNGDYECTTTPRKYVNTTEYYNNESNHYYMKLLNDTSSSNFTISSLIIWIMCTWFVSLILLYYLYIVNDINEILVNKVKIMMGVAISIIVLIIELYCYVSECTYNDVPRVYKGLFFACFVFNVCYIVQCICTYLYVYIIDKKPENQYTEIVFDEYVQMRSIKA